MDENLKKQLALVEANTIYEVVHGSHAYGMQLPTSDIDKKGVCLLPDRRLFYGTRGFEQQDAGWVDDKVVYHLPKFMKLAGECNPNIVEMLWVDNGHVLKITEAGKRLRAARDLFISKKARYTFSGYAHAQLQRIKAHKKWLDNPPKEPTEAEFKHKHEMSIGESGSEEFSERTRVVRLCASGITISEPPIPAPNRPGTYRYNGEFYQRHNEHFILEVEKFDKMGYEHAKREWDHFREWRKNRSAIRSELEAAHKYDTKHAAHLVRLLRMGYEIITEGVVRVKRPDAKELLGIRHGEWTYERVVGYAEDLDASLEEAYEKSTLPYAPQWEKIEELQMELIEDALYP